MDNLSLEVEGLERIYEGCDSDLGDLRIMRRALSIYRDIYKQLSSELLTDDDLENIATSLGEKAVRELSDDEPPWMPEQAIATITKHVRNTRETLGRAWTEEAEPLIEKLEAMDVSEANALFNKLTNPPSYLSSSQRKQVSRALTKVEARLSRIKIEWLVAKYEELEEATRKEFLRQIGATIQARQGVRAGL
jgi:hypothetical protein